MAPCALAVIGGTTASGKSSLAMRVAERVGGLVVNADSQQLFADLPILTARPSAADEARVPHRLYGVLQATMQPSVGRWLELVAELLAAADRRPLILCGGTGLYLKALLQGIAEMPAVPASLRQSLAEEAEREPTDRLHARLRDCDPTMAARLRPSDRQRILRALEVVIATGRSLADWQAAPLRRLELPPTVAGIYLIPPVAENARRIALRLEAMLRQGAVEEVMALWQCQPGMLQLPIAKVHGARELLAVARGQLPLEDASSAIEAQIRQYAKRQRTFIRHQLPSSRTFAMTADDPAIETVAGQLVQEIESAIAA